MKKSVFQRHPWRILVVAIACVALAVAIIYLAIPMADPVADTASSNERSIQTLDSKVRENKNSPSVILQKDLDDANTTSEEKVKTWEEMTAEDKHILYDKAAKLYMSGEWDGTEIILDGKTLKLASQCGGYILADGHQLAGYHNLDMPDNVSQYDWNTTNWVYVPGNGTYVIANKHIVKYLRGEENILPGEDLQWKGIQNTQEELEDISTDDYVYGTYKYNRPFLEWNETNQKLYLVTGKVDNPVAIGQEGGEYYLYVIPDLNRSEIEYIGKFSGTDIPEGENLRTLDLESIAHK